MLARIIFFAAVSAATLAVILLPLLSPVPRRSAEPGLALSLYVYPRGLGGGPPQGQAGGLHGSGAFVFRHELREGPASTSRVVGRARGVVVPVGPAEQLSTFNMVHLALDSPPAYAGSLSVEARARRVGRGGREEELVVVGGTGAFAFARGRGVFAATSAEAVYHLDLRLRFPESPTVPG